MIKFAPLRCISTPLLCFRNLFICELELAFIQVSIPECPICDMKEPSREHVSRHFSDELLEIVNQYPDPASCIECHYKADKAKTLSIHVALVHARLDMFLLDHELVASKGIASCRSQKNSTLDRPAPSVTSHSPKTKIVSAYFTTAKIIIHYSQKKRLPGPSLNGG